jgi:hypothetical protein
MTSRFHSQNSPAYTDWWLSYVTIQFSLRLQKLICLILLEESFRSRIWFISWVQIIAQPHFLRKLEVLSSPFANHAVTSFCRSCFHKLLPIKFSQVAGDNNQVKIIQEVAIPVLSLRIAAIISIWKLFIRLASICYFTQIRYVYMNVNLNPTYCMYIYINFHWCSDPYLSNVRQT